MKIRTRLFGAAGVLALAALFSLGACSKGNAPAAGGAAAAGAASAADSKVVAMVGGQAIYASDVQIEAEEQGVTEQGKALELDSAEFNRVLDQMIDVKLLAEEAAAKGLDQDPQARHRIDAAREHILGNILVEQVVSQKIDEAAVKKMYDAQVQLWEAGEEVRVRHIVTATKEEADKVLADLGKGADFAVLASQRSIDAATRLDGGSLGFISEDDASPELAKVIKTTPVGGLSKPFQSPMGWHVVKVEERRKQQPPSLEELRDPIVKHLTTVQIAEELKDLRAKSKIQKFTSAAGAAIETDPFTLAPVIPEGAKPNPAIEAAAQAPATPAPVADTRAPASPPPTAPAAVAPAKPAPEKTAAPAPAKKPTPAPKPAAKPIPPPEAPPAPVGESRPIDTQ